MDTKIVTIDGTLADEEKIKNAGAVIKAGGLVAFPTETVYGLGGDALNPDSAEKIYAAKGRPSDNPLIVHICKIEDLTTIAKEIPQTAYALAERFWPGPFTMIFHKADCVPASTTGGLDTVAVRMPAHETAIKLIASAGGFVAAPSANLSGRPSPTIARYVMEDMQGRIDMILDGGESDIGLESTILDMTAKVPMILRPGYVTKQMLAEVLGEVAADQTLMQGDTKEPPKAPGMKYRHYAPKGKLIIIEGNEEKVLAYINRQITKDRAAGLKSGVIATAATAESYLADSIKNVGSRENESAVAKQLFRILREFDDEKVSVIYAEAFARRGMGQAIMNRLLKAAGHHVISVDQEEKNDSIG